jgi:uncharacterized spore protein YtfJ
MSTMTGRLPTSLADRLEERRGGGPSRARLPARQAERPVQRTPAIARTVRFDNLRSTPDRTREEQTMSSNVPTQDTAPPEAPTVPPRRADELVASLAERVGGRVDASTVFAPPVERDGITVIPVATARFVVGGGSGSDPEKGQEGGGGGGLGRVAPAGYIELRDGMSRFVPIVNPARMALVVLAAMTMCAVAIGVRLPGQGPRRLRARWR